MRYPFDKLAKFSKAHEQCSVANAEAYDNYIPFTPFPLTEWMKARIQRRYAETGERTRTSPAKCHVKLPAMLRRQSGAE